MLKRTKMLQFVASDVIAFTNSSSLLHVDVVNTNFVC